MARRRRGRQRRSGGRGSWVWGALSVMLVGIVGVALVLKDRGSSSLPTAADADSPGIPARKPLPASAEDRLIELTRQWAYAGQRIQAEEDAMRVSAFQGKTPSNADKARYARIVKEVAATREHVITHGLRLSTELMAGEPSKGEVRAALAFLSTVSP